MDERKTLINELEAIKEIVYRHYTQKSYSENEYDRELAEACKKIRDELNRINLEERTTEELIELYEENQSIKYL